MSTHTIDFENTKLVTPGELRALAQRLRGVAMDFAAIELEDFIVQIEAQAQAEADALAAKRAADKLAAEEREEAARIRAEAYRNRPILGLRPGDLLVQFPNYTSKFGVTARHIGYVDETIPAAANGRRPYYRTRCGADANASNRAYAVGEHQRDATCKRCLTIAKKEGLL